MPELMDNNIPNKNEHQLKTRSIDPQQIWSAKTVMGVQGT